MKKTNSAALESPVDFVKRKDGPIAVVVTLCAFCGGDISLRGSSKRCIAEWKTPEPEPPEKEYINTLLEEDP